MVGPLEQTWSRSAPRCGNMDCRPPPSHCRTAVLRAKHSHRTVDQIIERVVRNSPAIDPATVYKTLETLERAGLVVRVKLGDKLTGWAHLKDLHHYLLGRAYGTGFKTDDGPFQHLALDRERPYGVDVDLLMTSSSMDYAA